MSPKRTWLDHQNSLVVSGFNTHGFISSFYDCRAQLFADRQPVCQHLRQSGIDYFILCGFKVVLQATEGDLLIANIHKLRKKLSSLRRGVDLTLPTLMKYFLEGSIFASSPSTTSTLSPFA